MQAVVLILESDNNPDVKEQALCILANIADGDNAKSYIMANEDVLKKVTNYLMHTNTKLQMAAVVCVYNLAYIGKYVKIFVKILPLDGNRRCVS